MRADLNRLLDIGGARWAGNQVEGARARVPGNTQCIVQLTHDVVLRDSQVQVITEIELVCCGDVTVHADTACFGNRDSGASIKGCVVQRDILLALPEACVGPCWNVFVKISIQGCLMVLAVRFARRRPPDSMSTGVRWIPFR